MPDQIAQSVERRFSDRVVGSSRHLGTRFLGKDIALQWVPIMILLPGGPASSVIQAIGRVIPVDREVPGLECRWRHTWFADDARKSRWPPYKRECAGTEGRWRHVWNKTTSLSQIGNPRPRINSMELGAVAVA